LPLDADRQRILETIATATITTVLLKKGLRNLWMRGTRPHFAAVGRRIAGEVFTLRFVPARHRGDARRLLGGGRRDGCFRRRHLRRHPA
jgi:regulator of RNase E activity RraA